MDPPLFSRGGAEGGGVSLEIGKPTEYLKNLESKHKSSGYHMELTTYLYCF